MAKNTAKLGYRNIMLPVTAFFSIVYVICGIFYAILPQQTIAFGSYLFHASLGMQAIPTTAGRFIIGLIETIILSIIGSALFVWLYNKIAGK